MKEQLFYLCIIVLNVFCLVIGVKIGQKVSRGETVELPKIEPVKTVREWNESKEARKEQEKNKIIAENIDNYKGNAIGQKDIPR